jgi:methyl-accepting chemotaxis protein
MLKNLKIHTKILWSFLIVALFGTALGIAGIATASRLSDLSSAEYNLELENVSIYKVQYAHFIWNQELAETIFNGGEFEGTLSPDACAFGVWYNSNEVPATYDTYLLSQLEKLVEQHTALHNEAAIALDYEKGGAPGTAASHFENVVMPYSFAVDGGLNRLQEHFALLIDEKSADIFRLEIFMRFINIGLVITAASITAILSLLAASMVCKLLGSTPTCSRRGVRREDIYLSPEALENIAKT